jgi:hypothetical protein
MNWIVSKLIILFLENHYEYNRTSNYSHICQDFLVVGIVIFNIITHLS